MGSGWAFSCRQAGFSDSLPAPRMEAQAGGSDRFIYGTWPKITPFRASHKENSPSRAESRQAGGTNGGKSVRLKKPVVMVGMMGAGKTAVGGEVARRLGVAFNDSDAEIERAANMSVAEIFARDGEAFFRKKEAQIIARLLGEQPGVLSVGGGAFLAEGTRALIGEAGVAVWLKASLPLLWARVRRKDTRPLLRTADPLGTLRALAEVREPVYALADLAVEVQSAWSIDETAQAVIAALATRPDVLESEARG
jgi:shikimate kinase